MYWGAETSVRDLKYSIGLIHLYFRKLNSLWQEIYLAFIIMKSSMQRRWDIEYSNLSQLYTLKGVFSTICVSISYPIPRGAKSLPFSSWRRSGNVIWAAKKEEPCIKLFLFFLICLICEKHFSYVFHLSLFTCHSKVIKNKQVKSLPE